MLYSAAPYKLTTYLDCPRRYRMAYLQRPMPSKGPPWAHNSLGSAVHTSLAKWWELPLGRRTPAAGGALVVNNWVRDGFRDERQSEDVREQAREYVERYLVDIDPAVEPIGVERTVGLTTPRAALSGRVDRIDERPGEGAAVVDYKTGRSVPTVDDARTSLALAIYAAAVTRTLKRPCTRVELHHLPTGERLVHEHSEESLGRHLRRADSIAAELAGVDARFKGGLPDEEADEMFPASVGPLCGWCDFQQACPAGQVVPKREPWAAIAPRD